jgi:hypothetical protein
MLETDIPQVADQTSLSLGKIRPPRLPTTPKVDLAELNSGKPTPEPESGRTPHGNLKMPLNVP